MTKCSFSLHWVLSSYLNNFKCIYADFVSNESNDYIQPWLEHAPESEFKTYIWDNSDGCKVKITVYPILLSQTLNSFASKSLKCMQQHNLIKMRIELLHLNHNNKAGQRIKSLTRNIKTSLRLLTLRSEMRDLLKFTSLKELAPPFTTWFNIFTFPLNPCKTNIGQFQLPLSSPSGGTIFVCCIWFPVNVKDEIKW